MDNKLTQDYKDNLYEKVLEKKAKRTAKRKRLASICVVFFIVACFATYGYTKYEKENYNNYFITESENIYIDDEYEYFDDLGIKLEFINTDKDSITIGVNIKYEDIADYFVSFEKIQIKDLNINSLIIKNDNELDEEYNWEGISKIIDKNTLQYIFKYNEIDVKEFKKFGIEIENCILEMKSEEKIIRKELKLEKEISIEK